MATPIWIISGDNQFTSGHAIKGEMYLPDYKVLVNVETFPLLSGNNTSPVNVDIEKR